MTTVLSLGSQVGSILGLLAVVLLPGLIAAVLWSPFLLSSRIQSLFASLPPRESTLVTYTVAAVGASLPFWLGSLAAIVGTEGASGAVMANAILDVIVPLAVVYVVGFPTIAIVVLPRVGVDWDPTGYGTGTWALLLVGGGWYAAMFAVPLFLVAVVLALPM